MPNIGKSKKRKKNKIEKVIFIDRDGVINCDPIGDYVKTWRDFRFIPGSLEALRRLTKNGYQIVIISNQAGIGDGVYPKKNLTDITRRMLARMKKSGIKIRGIFYCLHGKRAGCSCRKPKTGLFKKAAEKIHFKRRETFFIGDKVSDMLAGKRFGLRNVFVLTGHGRFDQNKLNRSLTPEFIARDLLRAVSFIEFKSEKM